MVAQKNEKTVESLKASLHHLIEAKESIHIQSFDRLYHKNIQVLMVDNNGDTMTFDKESFMKLIEKRLKEGNIQENSTSQFNYAKVTGDKGHIAITRQINLTGIINRLVLSIDFVWEDDRWQIVREVIFSQAI